MADQKQGFTKVDTKKSATPEPRKELKTDVTQTPTRKDQKVEPKKSV